VLVDPKRRDLVAYRGASVLTPNLGELALAAGCRLEPDDHEAIAEAARPFVYAAELESMVVTLGDRGMLLITPEAPPHHVPAVRRAVSDVTGAGDTVIATLALAIAAGANMPEAARLANEAASIVVGKFGAATVTPEELKSRF
jgi:D-beta-D-heptose 7-phosphate kinase/D-beta-D-heptose 1-phosphate adenosyltransferase